MLTVAVADKPTRDR